MPYGRKSGPREVEPKLWSWLVLAMVLACCSGSNGRPGSPTAPGTDQSPSFFSLTADLTAEGGLGILEVTVLLDGTDIDEELTYPTGGEDHAVVTSVELGIQPGSHVVALRFDRLSSSPATIAVLAGASYRPPDSSEVRVLFTTVRWKGCKAAYKIPGERDLRGDLGVSWI